ncbi:MULTISPECIES: hypothetical protein [unclassified Rhizobium]|nr:MULTISPECIES: hypothetical protein [unclassified Rhizobium]
MGVGKADIGNNGLSYNIRMAFWAIAPRKLSRYSATLNFVFPMAARHRV